MSLDAADPQERVEQLIALTVRLTGLMRRESDAFESHRPQDALAGAEETGRLANLYRHESMRIRKDPDLISGAPPAQRRKLLEATAQFDKALARHGRAVAAAKTVTEGLVRAIAEEVAGQRAVAAGYSEGGLPQTASATAVTLNRRA